MTTEDFLIPEQVNYLIPYAGMLLAQGAQLQVVLSEFGLEMGSDTITKFSQIQDFEALHSWGKENLLPQLLEEGEDEESQRNRL